jgi:hypothetical protein
VHPGLTYVASTDAAVTGADVLLHLTDWPEFAAIDPSRAGALVRHRCVVDGRNRLDPERWRAAGWSYHGLGRSGVPLEPAFSGATTAATDPVHAHRRRRPDELAHLEPR